MAFDEKQGGGGRAEGRKGEREEGEGKGKGEEGYSKKKKQTELLDSCGNISNNSPCFSYYLLQAIPEP